MGGGGSETLGGRYRDYIEGEGYNCLNPTLRHHAAPPDWQRLKLEG
jgi:hypothetical protein